MRFGEAIRQMWGFFPPSRKRKEKKYRVARSEKKLRGEYGFQRLKIK